MVSLRSRRRGKTTTLARKLLLAGKLLLAAFAASPISTHNNSPLLVVRANPLQSQPSAKCTQQMAVSGFATPRCLEMDADSGFLLLWDELPRPDGVSVTLSDLVLKLQIAFLPDDVARLTSLRQNWISVGLNLNGGMKAGDFALLRHGG